MPKKNVNPSEHGMTRHKKTKEHKKQRIREIREANAQEFKEIIESLKPIIIREVMRIQEETINPTGVKIVVSRHVKQFADFKNWGTEKSEALRLSAIEAIVPEFEGKKREIKKFQRMPPKEQVEKKLRELAKEHNGKKLVSSEHVRRALMQLSNVSIAQLLSEKNVSKISVQVSSKNPESRKIAKKFGISLMHPGKFYLYDVEEVIKKLLG